MALPYHSEPVLTARPLLIVKVRSPEDTRRTCSRRWRTISGLAWRTSGSADPYWHTVQEADRECICYCEDLVPETDLVGRLDFNAKFANVDEATE